MATKRWISTSNNSFTNDANWSGGADPVSGDVLIFDGTGSADLTADLSQAAIINITLIITHAHSGKIGSDTGGTATYLQIGASSVSIGRDDGGTGNGSQLILIDTGATTSAINILQTSSTSANTKYPPVSVKGSAITLTCSGGLAGIAVRPSETAAGVTVKTTRGISGGSPSIYMGSGTTPTLISIDSGDVYSLSDNTATAVRISGGRYLASGTGAHTLLNIDEGQCFYTGTGTITEAHVRGTLDTSADSRSKTITTCTVYRNGVLNVDNGVPGGIIFTNPINYPDGLSAVTVRTPAGVKGTLVAI